MGYEGIRSHIYEESNEELNYKIFCKKFSGDRLSIREQAADEAIKIVVDNF